MKQVSNAAAMTVHCVEGNDRLFLGDRGKVQVLPSTLVQEEPDKIIEMEPLHHDDDRAFDLVIEARQQGVRIPLGERIPCRLGLRLLRLERIIDDDEIAAAARQSAADGGG